MAIGGGVAACDTRACNTGADMSEHQLSALDLDGLLLGARALAERASQAIMAIYASAFSITKKQDRSPLTEADMASHHLLDAGLKQLEPRFPVLSEESDPRILLDRRRWKRYWLIDPLDGTREFVARNGEFAVNIALIENGAPVLGIVQAPARGDQCFATRDGGAWRVFPSVAASQAERLQARKAGVPVRVAVSRSHHPAELSSLLGAIGTHELCPLGSSLKFSALADGTQDIYPRLSSSSCEWDIAAGQCILEQAGGSVLDRSGKPLRYNQGAELLVPAFVAVGDPSVDWLARMQWRRET
jgi:3'(2'), 5'-bisphosphate nucleotidase